MYWNAFQREFTLSITQTKATNTHPLHITQHLDTLQTHFTNTLALYLQFGRQHYVLTKVYTHLQLPNMQTLEN